METTPYKSFLELIQEIDTVEREQRDRGTLFELLISAYLTHEPMYTRLFDAVWPLNEVPIEYNIPKHDTGVDLVARKRDTGDLVAVQCKFYSKDTIIQKKHIDSFLNEIGKNYYTEGLIVTTTDKWSKNADDALNNRNKAIMRISLSDLADSRIDWSQYSFHRPKEVFLQDRKTPRPHQKPAIEAVIDGFKNANRGKLIMAPGTGKTFTSLAIAEKMASEKEGTFKVLYLVPSIQLLSQTLRAWNADTQYNIDSIAVCSDRKVTKERIGTEIEDIATTDIGFPATTNALKLLEYQETIESKSITTEFIAVFSTYQSIDVIIDAQRDGFYDFDLIICDEAHRTTGTTELNQEASAFTKVHSNSNVQATKRLYQTATPRVYGEDAKKKAEENSIIIADMNDPDTYGEEFYRLGFGDAIRKGILTDYKVMVLAVEKDVIARRFQDMLANTESGLAFDDITKIVGCWNGLVKRDGNSNKTLGEPMKRAIAFTGTIKDSKKITEMFSTVVDEYLYKSGDVSEPFSIEIQHADGSMNAVEKNEKINWLKSKVPKNTCRVLSNARFLTEGVDVPDLDAVMFLKPRKSKIDIAQAVGRVMRKSEGKDYGYIILPIGVPAGAEAHSILDNNENYAVVWEILNALRSIDERFDATINKLELNKKKPDQLQIIAVGDAPEEGLEQTSGHEQLTGESVLFEEDLSDLERAIYGKIVQKVGNVRYWEQWSEDVAEIAQKHILRINVMLEDKKSDAYNEFKKFVKSLHHNINDSITEQQAIEMLSQHLITKPIFEALFDSYSFVNNNPVSQSMESILDILDKQGLMKEQEQLEGFYESVRIRAEGIDNLEAKQKIIIQLYDKFFKVGFKETTDRLGIVFTPLEVVDFIIRSVDVVLSKHFSKSIGDRNIHILDPFTGTGTFITRILNYLKRELDQGNIEMEDLVRKYTQELHANEIVLLSYYIAAINIEETFHSIVEDDYKPFEGIVLTDTFESTEHNEYFDGILLNENNTRLQKQKNEKIFAIVGNPPYSVGQKNANDNRGNINYPYLNKQIEKTYGKHTKSKLKKALYDSYILALRWASDRIADKGVISFVTNASFIDSNSTAGVRKALNEEFNYVYIFNLRGDQRTQGEQSRKEGGKIFGSGSRTPIAITVLVKDGSEIHKIYYNDIGDYLSREDKLSILSEKKSIDGLEWQEIIPDENHDWINQRDTKYNNYPSIEEFFNHKAIGISTNRDAWVYGFSKDKVENNALQMVGNYNHELTRLSNIKDSTERQDKRNMDPSYIKWTVNLTKKFKKNEKIQLDKSDLTQSMYRPFVKKWLFYNKDIIERPGQYKNKMGNDNKVIYITGSGASRDFSALVVNKVPNLHLQDSGQGFLKNIYREDNLLGSYDSNIALSSFLGLDLTTDELFSYIYAVLNSPEYKEKYSNDLNKVLPRIPLLKNKNKFIEVGQKLIDLHLNYETEEPYENVTIKMNPNPSFKVKKMKHPKKGMLDTIIFNSDITIKDIPEKAYEYVVNGRPAIEWIIDQYQVKTDKNSGIVDDPNDYSEDEKYIFNLLLRIINVSVQTVDLVNSLPELKIEE
ncbi:DEAD/DEAH box helicase [Oceanobacillus damuensis]|uniref:DEAD/DEAH box helicase n=1 Tax=Oceanobacillus damuensis TaxID=937928 RepID=UPI00082FECAE|nr:type ISP restriction/modification enzyme [Oceanobacillus damuensis]